MIKNIVNVNRPLIPWVSTENGTVIPVMHTPVLVCTEHNAVRQAQLIFRNNSEEKVWSAAFSSTYWSLEKVVAFSPLPCAYGYMPEELLVGDIVRIQLAGCLKRGCIGIVGLIDPQEDMPYRYRVDITEEEFYWYALESLEFIARPQAQIEKLED